MIRYVDTFKDQFGVEAICRVLAATECGFITARGSGRPSADRYRPERSPISCSEQRSCASMPRITVFMGSARCML